MEPGSSAASRAARPAPCPAAARTRARRARSGAFLRKSNDGGAARAPMARGPREEGARPRSASAVCGTGGRRGRRRRGPLAAVRVRRRCKSGAKPVNGFVRRTVRSRRRRRGGPSGEPRRVTVFSSASSIGPGAADGGRARRGGRCRPDDFLRFRARSLCNFRLVARAACDSSQL